PPLEEPPLVVMRLRLEVQHVQLAEHEETAQAVVRRDEQRLGALFGSCDGRDDGLWLAAEDDHVGMQGGRRLFASALRQSRREGGGEKNDKTRQRAREAHRAPHRALPACHPGSPTPPTRSVNTDDATSAAACGLASRAAACRIALRRSGSSSSRLSLNVKVDRGSTRAAAPFSSKKSALASSCSGYGLTSSNGRCAASASLVVSPPGFVSARSAAAMRRGTSSTVPCTLNRTGPSCSPVACLAD